MTAAMRSGARGISIRFDELHHYDIEASATTITARAVVAGIRQEWTVPAPGGPVDLHVDCVPVTSGTTMIELLTSDHIALGYTDPSAGERVQLANVDGRYLSQETAASFTGRVIGLYAVSGTVSFSNWRYRGDGG